MLDTHMQTHICERVLLLTTFYMYQHFLPLGGNNYACKFSLQLLASLFKQVLLIITLSMLFCLLPFGESPNIILESTRIYV